MTILAGLALCLQSEMTPMDTGQQVHDELALPGARGTMDDGHRPGDGPADGGHLDGSQIRKQRVGLHLRFQLLKKHTRRFRRVRELFMGITPCC